ncbi:hypothetical protein [Desulfonatronum parangueonense]
MRSLGGMLELMIHCHFVVTVEGVELDMPEVTLPAPGHGRLPLTLS